MARGWKGATLAVAVGLAVSAALAAIDNGPDISWAYPTLASPNSTPPSARHTLSGSTRRYTEAQIRDRFRAVDWHPERRATAPKIVRVGHQPGAMPCGYCHLPSGQGRPENASLAGLPADYIDQQVANIAAGLRPGARPDYPPAVLMRTVAANVTPAEVGAAANWFAAQRFEAHTRVVETAVAHGAVAEAGVYRFDPKAPVKPLGARILEGPIDFGRFELRDDSVDYVAFVPVGSIARGRHLAITGDGFVRAPCATCHGVGLRGAFGPPLAGRSPTGLFRQLYAFNSYARRGYFDVLMRQQAAKLSEADMIDLAAYAGSLKP